MLAHVQGVHELVLSGHWGEVGVLVGLDGEGFRGVLLVGWLQASVHLHLLLHLLLLLLLQDLVLRWAHVEVVDEVGDVRHRRLHHDFLLQRMTSLVLGLSGTFGRFLKVALALLLRVLLQWFLLVEPGVDERLLELSSGVRLLLELRLQCSEVGGRG